MSSPFNVNVARDVRVHVSDRGVRTTVASRAGARLGVGVSRFAVGLGYGLVAGAAAEARRGTTAMRSAVVDRLDRKAADRADELATQIRALEALHRQEFPRTSRPPVPSAPGVDERGIRAKHKRAALAGVGVLALRRRAELEAQARVVAEAEIESLRHHHESETLRKQLEIEVWWNALMVNDSDLVMDRLTTAFADNGATAAPVCVTGDEVTFVVIAPPESVVPDSRDERTADGKLGTRKLSRTERNELYLTCVMGHLLVTAKEAFAVAPATNSASVVVLRVGRTMLGQQKTDCLVAGRWTREALSAVPWADVDAVTAARTSAVELLVDLEPDKELRPLKIFDQPGLKALMAAVEVEDSK